VAALAAAALAALLMVPLASAHESIVSTKPSGSAKVGLGSVTVTFSGPIRSGTLKVFAADGTKVSKSKGGRDPRNVSRLRSALKRGLGPGRYTARAKWVGADGHHQSAKFRFRLVR
jgi:methionine-rich copper-binding protein CopC